MSTLDNPATDSSHDKLKESSSNTEKPIGVSTLCELPTT